MRLHFQLLIDEPFDSEAGPVFVRHLSRHPRAPMPLVWHRPKTHRGSEITTFLNLVRSILFFFPPHAPDLNPVEYV